MKKILFFFLLFLTSFPFLSGQNLKVMTYNIRYANDGDGENRWQFRKETLAGVIKFHEPDIFGIQEGLDVQIKYFDTALVNYRHIGIGRDSAGAGEHADIFYNIKRFELLKQGMFWLSETPEKLSIGWDAALNRICTYGLFKDKATGKKVWFFNTHFDHMGNKARINSAKLIFDKIKSVNPKDKYPVILTGDFNLEPKSDPIQYLSAVMNNSMYTAKEVFGNTNTFNNFEFNKPLSECIDYIFTSKNSFQVLKYAVLSDSKNCHYPSDHCPVYAEMKYSGKTK